MKKRFVATSLLFTLVVVLGGLTAADADTEKKEFAATCPVSGQPAIEESVVTLANDDKVYFCCKNCPKAFEKDPEKFALPVTRQLLETGQIVQVACPVSGQPVSDEAVVEVGTAKVTFCCENCQAKYDEANDEDKLKVLFADFKKGFTRQTTCPVSGKAINPEVTVEHEGEKVYFCCPGCPAGFEADPAKYTAKLPQFKEKK